MIIPILGMIADWAENYVELLMLEIYLNSIPISEILVSLGSGINSFKWVLSSLTYFDNPHWNNNYIKKNSNKT